MTESTRISLRVATEDDEGFFEKLETFTTIQEGLSSGNATQMRQAIGQAIEWLLPFVVAPDDRDAARAALRKASRREIMDAMAAALGNEGGQAATSSA